MSWNWLWYVWTIWLCLLIQYALGTQALSNILKLRWHTFISIISACGVLYLYKIFKRDSERKIMFKRKEQVMDKTDSDYNDQKISNSINNNETYLGDDIELTVKQPSSLRPVASSQNGTVIPETCSIIGELNSTGDIHVNGKIEGVIRSDKAIHILKSGHVEGDIYAQEISVDGILKGNCIGTKVTINANGFIEGVIQSSSLAIDSAGCFYGTSKSLDLDNTSNLGTSKSLDFDNASSLRREYSTIEQGIADSE